MRGATRCALIGLVLGAGVASGGLFWDEERSATLDRLVEECRRGIPHRVPGTQTPSFEEAPDWLESYPVLCEPSNLTQSSQKGAAIQERIKAQYRRPRYGPESVELGLALAFVMCLPYGWYFLLRRIRELRDAIAGMPEQ